MSIWNDVCNCTTFPCVHEHIFLHMGFLCMSLAIKTPIDHIHSTSQKQITYFLACRWEALTSWKRPLASGWKCFIYIWSISGRNLYFRKKCVSIGNQISILNPLHRHFNVAHHTFGLLLYLYTDLINSLCLLPVFSSLICCQTFSDHLSIVKHFNNRSQLCVWLYPMQPGSLLP